VSGVSRYLKELSEQVLGCLRGTFVVATAKALGWGP
jgi:hypothetical protein